MPKKPPLAKLETFHKVIGELMGAFAQIEAAMVLAINAAGKPVKSDALATRLKTVRGLPNPPLSETQADRLAHLIPIRAEIAHGTMTIVDLDSKRFACFRNARHAASKFQPATLISHKTMREMVAELAAITSDIEKS